MGKNGKVSILSLLQYFFDLTNSSYSLQKFSFTQKDT